MNRGINYKVSGQRLDLPNAITLARYVGASLFWVCSMSASPLLIKTALLILIVTYLTDIADGLIARSIASSRDSKEGNVLDSAADTYTITVVFFVLSQTLVIPGAVFMFILAGRALLDMLRFVSLARGSEYARPTRLTKIKGLVYAIISIVLYAGWAIKSLTWFSSQGFRIIATVVLVGITVLSCGTFLARHRRLFMQIMLLNQ